MALKMTYRNHIEGSNGDTTDTSPEKDLEDAHVKAGTRKTLVDRAQVRLVDTLTLKDVVA